MHMNDLLWSLVFLQVALGGFDSLYHHELTERLAWRVSQQRELTLHGVRNLAYALMFTALGWSEPHGTAAMALIVVIVGEVFITLWDFVEEDRTRRLPPSERVTHALLTLNYGVILAMLIPVLLAWALLPTTIRPAYQGYWSWLCLAAAISVIVLGLRDLAAATRSARIAPGDPAPLASSLERRYAVLVTGATGFIGSRLVAALVFANHDVTVLTRKRANAADLPAPLRIVTSLDQIADDFRFDAVINLAGEPIVSFPWTRRKRQRIVRSRLKVTREIMRLIRRLQKRPAVLVSGSAIGWYGMRGDEILDEHAGGTDCFSRSLCQRWERAARGAADLGIRVVCLRIGLVLAAEGGVLARLLMPFEFGFGGPIGDGRQWMSWIHRDDLVRLIVHALATPSLAGPVNATAPSPVTNAAFSAVLGRALRRPAVLRLPAGLLRLVLGRMAEELLLNGQRVVPVAARGTGFQFAYPEIDQALAVIVSNRVGTDSVLYRPTRSV